MNFYNFLSGNINNENRPKNCKFNFDSNQSQSYNNCEQTHLFAGQRRHIQSLATATMQIAQMFENRKY